MKDLASQFSSSLAQYFIGMIEEKRACGYKYTELSSYTKFDCFLVEQKHKKISLPRKIVEQWLKKQEALLETSSKTHQCRVTAVRNLADFLIRQGISAYSPPHFFNVKVKYNYVPYIYSHKEISSLFKAADELSKTNTAWHLSYFPVAIRLFYSTGLRKGEVKNLLWRDIDLENGVITIRQGKHHKDRFIPITMQMLKILKDYAQKKTCDPDTFVFHALRSDKIRTFSFYDSFRQVLFQAGIPFKGKRNGPHLHCLRHTFAVHNLERWLKNKENLQIKLPILADYLGHESILATQRYLRLTPTILPEITARMEKSVGKLIRSYHNETD